MTSTPIFDALAEELEAPCQNSGEIPEQAVRSVDAVDQDVRLSGCLE
ncbi:hypothetical protein SK803_32405 [Lentzea sp. BCCO 10_0856]|uniref:Uncharacterized protein n=1 Tax=Lentzea miocenica TaxID=3095431 RepID=A0ABU4TAK0_9PSEU|nr:hypothetical protein [Lentzea sp. BCCO 10_0856]MDX8034943.1 hypothetical protein [Lentzea sp. BCCO 10_0856]